MRRTTCVHLFPCVVALAAAAPAFAQGTCPTFTTSFLRTYDALGNPELGQAQQASAAWTFRRSQPPLALLVAADTGAGRVWASPDQSFAVPIVYPRCSPTPARNECPFTRRTPGFEGVFFHPGYPGTNAVAMFRPAGASEVTALTLQAELLGNFSPDMLVSVVLRRTTGDQVLIAPTSIPKLAPAQTLSPPGGTFPLFLAASDRILVIADCNGTVEEDWGNLNATIVLAGPPLILESPRDAIGCAGTDPATLKVYAEGASAYRWRRNGVPIFNGPTPTGSIISGAGTATLSISPVTSGDAATYTCLVTGACGQTLSDPAVLTVPCCPDVNHDGAVDQGDVDYLINLVAGGGNPSGIDPDFNADGNIDQADIDALIDVVAGGNCP